MFLRRADKFIKSSTPDKYFFFTFDLLSLFNLHTHTRFSDGSSDPSLYIEEAIKQGFTTPWLFGSFAGSVQERFLPLKKRICPGMLRRSVI